MLTPPQQQAPVVLPQSSSNWEYSPRNLRMFRQTLILSRWKIQVKIVTKTKHAGSWHVGRHTTSAWHVTHHAIAHTSKIGDEVTTFSPCGKRKSPKVVWTSRLFTYSSVICSLLITSKPYHTGASRLFGVMTPPYQTKESFRLPSSCMVVGCSRKRMVWVSQSIDSTMAMDSRL